MLVRVIVVVVLADLYFMIFFFKQKTAYEMRISDWSSDVCSSDLSSSEETADYQRSAVVDVPGSGVRAMRVVHRAASGRAKPVGCCGCLDHGPCGGYVDAWSHA